MPSWMILRLTGPSRLTSVFENSTIFDISNSLRARQSELHFFLISKIKFWVKTIVTPPVNGRFTADLWQISCTHPLQPLIRYPELPKCAPEGLPMSAVLFRCVEAHRKRFSSGRGPKRPCRRGCGPAAQDCQVEDLREVVTRIHAYMAASP